MMNDIQSTLKFKNNKVETPNFYLGEKEKKKELCGKEVWTISSTNYIKPAVEKFEEQLQKKGDRLPFRVVTPMSQGYYPETDFYPELYQYGMSLLVLYKYLGYIPIPTFLTQ